ncbi:protein kinase family protein [Paenibacillus sp. 1011MAR3C5]|uniref:protein kinase domain-containing protein n=1 Tax=Paenibacillus sp. 1011MAR3C5 TaxID=1675787 RepID=UPI000E6D55F8|nr:serine/threonine-protein kinase [Paenibacillus sp. 1011MAR3C5]RJE84292.1 protein kinase family protein [Paenibacillus sp. 1011MAR3C5]
MLGKIAGKLKEIIDAWRDYPLQPGVIWEGRYRIDRLLGMGSYGQAYACTDLSTGSVALLKRNKPSKGSTGIELLRRESDLMSSLEHPQIPKWLNYSVRRRDEALIMQYIEGHNLEFGIYEQGVAYSAYEALAILKALLAPLTYLHAQGYVHRDVRIPNVMQQDGKLFLIDLGLACRIGERLPSKLQEALGEAEGSIASDSASAIKRRMRSPLPSSDWFGLGHLFLFLMYAGYEHPEGQPEKTWEEELSLQSEVQWFISKLLHDESAWETTEQCQQELDELLTRLELAEKSEI